MHSVDLHAAAPTTDGFHVRLESPRDVEFAMNALLGCATRDAEACARAREDILVDLRPAPTLEELVDAVFVWRHAQPHRAEELEKAEEAARRRDALLLLRAYFLLDPPVPGEAGGLAS